MALSVLPNCFERVLQPVVGDRCTVFQATMAEVAGIQHECGLAVVTGSLNFEPCISLISCLFIIDGHLYIVGSDLETQTYCRHFHFYSGTLATTYKLYSTDYLIDPFPVSVYMSSDSSACAIMKHRICYSEAASSAN